MREPVGALYQRFRRTAEKRAHESAFTFLDARNQPARYTFAELFARSDRIATALQTQEIDRTAPLGILLRSQEAQVLHYLAALSIGLIPAILTPPNRKLNRRYYEETMAAVLARSGFGALVTDLEGLSVNTPIFTPETIQPANKPAVHRNRSAQLNEHRPDASFLQFSSGTTGIKRGVLVTDEAVLAQLDTYAAAFSLTTQDRILSWLPLYHDMGFIACLNMPLAFGVHTVMIDPIDWVSNPACFLKAAAAYRATLAWNPNFAYAFMARRVRDEDLRGIDLSSLRGLVNCSEPVTHESQQQFLERFAPCGLPEKAFFGCYAMAETTFAITHGTCDAPGYLDDVGPTDGSSANARRHVSVGQPLPGVELAIVSAEGQFLPDRCVGEIWVKSPFNFTGYYNDAESTAKALADGWYRTGDLGYRAGDSFYVSGRKKDVLIVGGVNVFPQDIEDLVSQVEGLRAGRVSAFSSFDARVQTEQVIILAESELQDEQAQQVILGVRQRILACFQIANFEVHIVPTEWLVKSSSGKMARSANRQKWTEGRSHAHPEA